MGGEGSGRHADPVKQLIGFNQPVASDNGGLYIPNYSGVQKEALVGAPKVGTGGGAVALDDLSDVTLSSPASNEFLKYDGSKWVNAVVGAGTETDPVFVALSGAFIKTETDPVWVAASGAYLKIADLATSETDPIFVALSGGISAYEVSGAPSVSGAVTAHLQDITDPHGTTLAQTNIVGTGIYSGAYVIGTTSLSGAKILGTIGAMSSTFSGAKMVITNDVTASGTVYVPNVVYGTVSGAYTASNYTQGTLLLIHE